MNLVQYAEQLKQEIDANDHSQLEHFMALNPEHPSLVETKLLFEKLQKAELSDPEQKECFEDLFRAGRDVLIAAGRIEDDNRQFTLDDDGTPMLISVN